MGERRMGRVLELRGLELCRVFTFAAGLWTVALSGCFGSSDPPSTAIGAIAAASSCDGSSGPGLPAFSGSFGPGSISETDGWSWYNATPTGAWLHAIAAAGDSDVWIGGASDTALHHDGTTWSATPTGLKLTEAMWASATNDVWASGIGLDGGGAVVHGDGHAFGAPVSLPIGEAMDLWGTSANDVYVVGNGGLMHFDGQSWTPVAGAQGSSIAGTAADDIWVGSYDGVRHFDGASWIAVPEMQNRYVVDIAVSGPGNVWAVVSENGGATVYHFDGAGWTSSFREEGSSVIHGIAASSETDVWLVGSHYGPAAEQNHLRLRRALRRHLVDGRRGYPRPPLQGCCDAAGNVRRRAGRPGRPAVADHRDRVRRPDHRAGEPALERVGQLAD